MFAGLFNRGDEPKKIIFGKALSRIYHDQPGLALGERSGLVDHHRINLLEGFQCFGALDQYAVLRAFAGSNHDRHRRCQAQRAGTGDNKHSNSVDQREAQRRRRTPDRPSDKGNCGTANHGRDKPTRNAIGELLDWSSASLCFSHHLDDLGEQRVLADPLGDHDEAAGLVDRAASDGVASTFVDGNGLARHHRFINIARSALNLAVHWYLAARPDAQPVALANVGEGHFLLRTVNADADGNGWSQLQQGPQSPGSLPARLELEHLAQQH